MHRHSGSKTVNVRLLTSQDKVVLEVCDQGRGMAAISTEEMESEALGRFGAGLRGMNERVRQLRGELEIASGPAGTTVRATLPTVEVPEP